MASDRNGIRLVGKDAPRDEKRAGLVVKTGPFKDGIRANLSGSATSGRNCGNLVICQSDVIDPHILQKAAESSVVWYRAANNQVARVV